MVLAEIDLILRIVVFESHSVGALVHDTTRSANSEDASFIIQWITLFRLLLVLCLIHAQRNLQRKSEERLRMVKNKTTHVS